MRSTKAAGHSVVICEANRTGEPILNSWGSTKGLDEGTRQRGSTKGLDKGATVIISITVTNTATLPMGYRLRRNNANVPDSFISINQRTAFFSISNVGPPFTNYAIIVTNVARSSGNLSSSAFLTFLIDTDGDGIPDNWESAYGLNTNDVADAALDTDGDRMSNWQEYVAGTDPIHPSSYLKVEIIGFNAGATITFGAVSNRTYTVQFTDALPGGGWQKLTDIGARGINRTETVVDPNYTTNRFYRLATPRRP